jgi:hypothetical protein
MKVSKSNKNPYSLGLSGFATFPVWASYILIYNFLSYPSKWASHKYLFPDFLMDFLSIIIVSPQF